VLEKCNYNMSLAIESLEKLQLNSPCHSIEERERIREEGRESRETELGYGEQIESLSDMRQDVMDTGGHGSHEEEEQKISTQDRRRQLHPGMRARRKGVRKDLAQMLLQELQTVQNLEQAKELITLGFKRYKRI
jgi:hypothetical protein